MKIKVTNQYSNDVSETTLAQLVAHSVDGSDYDQGRLEDMAATISKQTNLLAKIVEKLNLSNEELNAWFETYRGEIYEKIES